LENTKYTFVPIPGTPYKTVILKNRDQRTGQIIETKRQVYEESTSFCDVNTERHVEHLLKLPFYEEYDQEKIDAEQKEAEGKKSPMKGFAIEKYGDKGYVAVDRRKKPIKYAGESCQWVEKGGDIVPFKSELEAFNFLNEEAQTPGDEVEEDINELTGKGKKTK
jgi:hypothetical protein